jgi:lipoprotein-anchoring transpeptidase ErfK/SrfK
MKRQLIAVLLAGASLLAQEPSQSPAPQNELAPVPTPAPSSETTVPPEAPAPTGQEAFPTAETKPAKPSVAIEIDLSEQKAWVLQDGQRVYETSISSGRTGFETPSGSFSVVQKDLDHKSTLYGKLVDSKGRVLSSDADCATPVPPGATFQPAPMKHFLRISGAVGMHAGRLPGYPASHGCIRLPPSKAALFYNVAEVGTPVRVFGTAPHTDPAPKKPTLIAAAATPEPGETKRRGLFWFLKR